MQAMRSKELELHATIESTVEEERTLARHFAQVRHSRQTDGLAFVCVHTMAQRQRLGGPAGDARATEISRKGE
jgi:hypothetical protein